MNVIEPTRITSRDNGLLKDLKRLAQENASYRKQGRVWLEGDHLCRAALARGLQPARDVTPHGAFELLVAFGDHTRTRRGGGAAGRGRTP